MNLFEHSMNDFEYILNQMGQTVLVNEMPMQALITVTTPGNRDDRKISTLEPIRQGDIVDYNSSKWLVINDASDMRYSHYKGVIRKCNHTISIYIPGEEIIIGEDAMGRPIIKHEEGQTLYIPCIVETKSFSIDGNGAINLQEGKIFVTTQDTETNRENLKVNATFSVMDSNWTVIHIDKTKVGLFILSCQNA